MRLLTIVLVGLVLIMALPAVISGQVPDDVHWSTEFASINGVNGKIRAMVVYDDKLVIGGSFTQVGGKDIAYIAAWDGYGWSAIGDNNIRGAVCALHVYNGNLYAGGRFSIDEEDPIFGKECIAYWNGSYWNDLNAYCDDTVHTITDWDGKIVIGGRFTDLRTNSATRVAWYQAGVWNRMDVGLPGPVYALTVYGGELYAGGDIDHVNSVHSGGILRWTGTQWVRLSSYLSSDAGDNYPIIRDLMVIDGNMVAAGVFNPTATPSIRNIGAYNGSAWSAFGTGVSATMGLYDIDTTYEGHILAGGYQKLVKWDGANWTTLAQTDAARRVYAVCEFLWDPHFGGNFETIDGEPMNYIAEYDNDECHPIKEGINGQVQDVLVYNDQVMICGPFRRVGNVAARYIGAWNGSSWSPTIGVFESVPTSLVVHNDTLYGLGAFGTMYPDIYPLVKYTGISWETCGPSMMNVAQPLVGLSYDEQIVLGGVQTSPFPFLYTTTGTGYGVLGGQLSGPIYALCEYGGMLVAGGVANNFDGLETEAVAAWNGSNWVDLGGGVNGGVWALTVYDGNLVVGGIFDSAGSVAANNVAMWNGSSWNTLGSGTDGLVRTLAVFDGKLIAGGNFDNAGGSPASNIASWDETDGWLPLGSGTDSLVWSVVAHDSSLYVGGSFQSAGGHSSAFFARWDKYGSPTAVDDDGSSGLPGSFILRQNYPNPFNPGTEISFSLPHRSQVTLTVYNVLGQQVKRLLNRELPAGDHEVTWDGTDHMGRTVASGVYLYRLQAGDVGASRKMMLVK